MKEIMVIVGYECNNMCLFCSVGDKDRSFNRTYDDIVQNMAGDYENGFRSIQFLGGEATIRKDIINIVRKAKEIGYEKISFETNGRMFCNEMFTKKIIDAGLTYITFSIHGHTAKIHDTLTQVPGSFEQAIRGIREARKYEGVVVAINHVVNKLNYEYLENFVRFIEPLGASWILFIFINPIANARKNYRRLVPKLSETMKCMKEAITSSSVNGYKTRISIQNIPLCILGEYGELSTTVDNHRDVTMNFEDEKKPQLSDNIERLKIRPDKCNACKKKGTCDGVWRGYYEIFGDDELKPIT